MDLVNRIKQTSLNLAEALTPVLKDSKFKESGRLNPEEFIAAGDHLVYSCPTWNWSSGDEGKLKNYLPKEKQFLVTRNVPCQQRCKQMEDFSAVEKLVEGEEGADGWVTHETENDGDGNDSPAEMTLENMNLNDDNVTKNDNEDDEEEEALDMEDFEESGRLETVDPSVAIIQPKASSSAQDDDNEKGDSIVQCRTYDLYICYNKYYQTPHLFLIGYDENRKMLTMEQMFEDVSQDNAKKTVTMEPHPHLGISLLAVHPCRHSDLMKKFIQIAEEGGNELSVHAYLIIFLKFVQSVIPTINYDFSTTVKTN